MIGIVIICVVMFTAGIFLTIYGMSKSKNEERSTSKKISLGFGILFMILLVMFIIIYAPRRRSDPVVEVLGNVIRALRN